MTTQNKLKKLLNDELEQLNNNTLYINEIIENSKTLPHENKVNFIYDVMGVVNTLKQVNQEIQFLMENSHLNFTRKTSKEIYEMEKKYKRIFLLYTLFQN